MFVKLFKYYIIPHQFFTIMSTFRHILGVLLNLSLPIVTQLHFNRAKDLSQITIVYVSYYRRCNTKPVSLQSQKLRNNIMFQI